MERDSLRNEIAALIEARDPDTSAVELADQILALIESAKPKRPAWVDNPAYD